MIPITHNLDDYADAVTQMLHTAGLQVLCDKRSEKISYKIREHSERKVPVVAVVGQREAERSEVSLRRLGSQQQVILALKLAVQQLSTEARSPLMQKAGELS